MPGRAKSSLNPTLVKPSTPHSAPPESEPKNLSAWTRKRRSQSLIVNCQPIPTGSKSWSQCQSGESWACNNIKMWSRKLHCALQQNGVFQRDQDKAENPKHAIELQMIHFCSRHHGKFLKNRDWFRRFAACCSRQSRHSTSCAYIAIPVG